MTKKQLKWSFPSLHLNVETMTKEEMLDKIAPVLTEKVIEKVNQGGEY